MWVSPTGVAFPGSTKTVDESYRKLEAIAWLIGLANDYKWYPFGEHRSVRVLAVGSESLLQPTGAATRALPRPRL
jgi:hypothetical protein